MATAVRTKCDRRGFLGTLGAATIAACGGRAWGDDRPVVTDPRATSGDDRHEPNWQERLTLSVGPKNAQLAGADDKVIQAAVDYMARLGGGTVKIQPGTYKLRNAVYLRSKVRLVGSGADSVLIKEPSVTSALSDDSDWYDQEITLADAAGFEVGDGVCLRAKNPHNGGTTVVKRTLVARSGNRFKLDKAPRENLWLSGKPTASTLFPIFSGEEIADVVIEDLVFDGAKANNENLDGNHAGCIFLQDCNRIAIRGVTARNYNGDGISWQICHDVLVENCHSHDNVGLGLHPGSGSQRPVMRNNHIERNDVGIFFCWGVRHGLAENNRIEGIRRHGISIGHRDTDNLVRGNEVVGSGEVGILFRSDDRGKDFWPNRNRVIDNRVVDTGGEEAVAVDVRGKTRAILLSNNEIVEKRAPMRRVGVRIGPETGAVELDRNRIDGFDVAIDDRRKSTGS